MSKTPKSKEKKSNTLFNYFNKTPIEKTNNDKVAEVNPKKGNSEKSARKLNFPPGTLSIELLENYQSIFILVLSVPICFLNRAQVQGRGSGMGQDGGSSMVACSRLQPSKRRYN